MNRKILIGFILFLSYFLLIPGALSEVNAIRCGDQKPATAPVLVSAVPKSGSVILTWIPAQDPVTFYLVAYGRSETEFEYGNPNVGGRETTTYTVGELTNGTKYYFKVRAQNGCKPGKFSNKLSAVPGSSGVNTVSRTPNLSIYKSVMGASISATPIAESVIEKSGNKTVVSSEVVKCLTCLGWQLLLIEAILLILYMFLVDRVRFLKPIFSIFIPIVIYIVFIRTNGVCSYYNFSCKYFLQLEIIVFMLSVMLYKNKHTSLRIQSMLGLFKKK